MSFCEKSRFINNTLFQKIQENIPIPCVDLVVLRKSDKNGLEVLLFKRKILPEIGKWVNIGGRILKGEHLDETIERQAQDEFGVSVSIISPYMPERPVAVFSEPECDPHKHPITLVYPVQLRAPEKLHDEGPEFSEHRWFPLDQLPANMGFEPLHRKEILCVAAALRTC